MLHLQPCMLEEAGFFRLPSIFLPLLCLSPRVLRSCFPFRFSALLFIAYYLFFPLVLVSSLSFPFLFSAAG